ncbi:unnamed protein product [Psylliodes chrysocephalus]|uniref:Uncharacterized protein n=1 Tax=Psylliodes chrysocephalus TaxID=3402493 RepID=A0A9P0CSY7_9CUCU|nr:unnamed protein product [Psylliodes chrysocephala]
MMFKQYMILLVIGVLGSFLCEIEGTPVKMVICNEWYYENCSKATVYFEVRKVSAGMSGFVGKNSYENYLTDVSTNFPKIHHQPTQISNQEVTENNQIKNTYENIPANIQTKDSFENIPANNQTKDTYQNITANNQTKDTYENITANNQTKDTFENIPANNQTRDTFENIPANNQTKDIYENVAQGIFEKKHAINETEIYKMKKSINNIIY